LRQALELNPNHAQALQYLGEVRGLQARWLAARGQARMEDFEEAAQAYQKALVLAPQRQDYRLAFGQFRREWAAWHQKTGQAPDPLLMRALDMANELLAARPEWPDARLLRASVLLRLAETAAPEEQRRGWREQAGEDLSRALASNPQLEHEWKRPAVR
ncbi:MAG: serine/threonine protein kinase, partial [Archangium sp.]